MTYKIPRWDDFQQYKDRRPTWIKLERSLLDNMHYHAMSESARAMLPLMWLLASENKIVSSGEIDLTDAEICFRLRLSKEKFAKNIAELINYGFIKIVHNCTEVYENVPREEKRREETEKDVPKSDFDSFWKVYPIKKAVGRARDAYAKALKKTDHATIMAGAMAYAADCVGKESKFIAHAATWLNGSRWADEYETKPIKPAVPDWIKAQYGGGNG